MILHCSNRRNSGDCNATIWVGHRNPQLLFVDKRFAFKLRKSNSKFPFIVEGRRHGSMSLCFWSVSLLEDFYASDTVGKFEITTDHKFEWVLDV